MLSIPAGVRRPDIVTTYGPDFLPYAAGFHLHPAKPQATATARNENHTRGNTRIFYTHNAEVSAPPEITPEIIKLVGQADIVILASLLSNYTVEYVQTLMSHAKPSALKALTVQGYLREVDSQGLIHPRDFVEAAAILPLFDVAIFSDADYPQALEIAREWKKKSPTTDIIVTEGPLGASVIGSNTSYDIPTTPVPPKDIIDSVGCGDVFAAALAYHYCQKRDLRVAIKAAHLAARLKLTAAQASTM